MSATKIKICGVTSPTAAQQIANAGADAIGLMLYAPSKRFVDQSTAAEIASAIPQSVAKVGVFVNETLEVVRETVEALQLDLVQLQGNESIEYCQQLNCAYIKAVPAQSSEQITQAAQLYSGACALMLDTPADGQFGGSGQAFDTDVVPDLDCRLVMAGGLTAETVVDVVLKIRPYAVDVSTGVESSKGVKDLAKVSAFIDAVRSVEVA